MSSSAESFTGTSKKPNAQPQLTAGEQARLLIQQGWAEAAMNDPASVVVKSEECDYIGIRYSPDGKRTVTTGGDVKKDGSN
ncbi:hypothetical protein NLJ89_g9331 [Agrocybe chaxingu]|uniref:Uncharacterized protein n=1 Tax=Agrocybe chaxingu TaxID=84603 RepID=A0A9W8JSN1_9AGAR|nr:hypothetical protein NLJ89_g9331 [Agrocybe chaxingu]